MEGRGYEVPGTHGGCVSNAGIMLSDDVCQLMLIRYGGPNLQMDFVGFVHLMLRAENMEGELGWRGLPPHSSWVAHLAPVEAGEKTAPRAETTGQELWSMLALCPRKPAMSLQTHVEPACPRDKGLRQLT